MTRKRDRYETKGAATREREHTAFLVSELKATNDNAGTFEGYVAVFNNLDGNGDVIERGAFKRTLGLLRETKQRQNNAYLFPLLWQHNEEEPIGGVTEAYEDDHGLYIKGDYDLDVPRGAQAYSGAKKGYLRGLSIGYRTVKSMIGQNRERRLLEIQLFEGSPVTFPANTDALTMSVKSVSGKTDWPLAPDNTAWDSGAAHARLLEWAGGKGDKFDPDKFASVHFWKPDDADKTNVSDYKFPFCDVIGGSVKAVPAAIYAATGSHGIQAAKGVDVEGIKSKIAAYYKKMDKPVPWKDDGKGDRTPIEQKQLTGLAALVQCATSADNCADRAEPVVEMLANSCGLSMDDDGAAGKPSATVSALLGGTPGLEDAVRAVITAFQDFSQQTDALLAVLGLPDNDYGYDSDYGYNALQALLESKTGRQLNQSNRDRIQAVADGLSGHAAELKSLLKDNDNPLKDENATASDYGDYIASGAHNQPSGGKGKNLTRQDSGNTTLDGQAGDPEATLLTTLQTMEDDMAAHNLSRLLSVGK